PGSKSTMRDLIWLRERGLAEAVLEIARSGGAILGVCGGFQMLGRALNDPDGVESADRSMPGLGLLPVETTFTRVKTTVRVRPRAPARVGPSAGVGDRVFDAYEIHAGVTTTTGDVSHPFALVARDGASTSIPEGASNALGTVTGTYLHGAFAGSAVRRSLLTW